LDNSWSTPVSKAGVTAEIRQNRQFSSGCREGELVLAHRILAMLAARLAAVDTGAERLVNDGLDGSRATTAFGAAAETAVHFLGAAWKLVRRVDGLADIVIA
jgi:hypothetical protein